MKMLKEAETKETIGFFVIGDVSIGGGLLGHPLATAMDLLFREQYYVLIG